MATPAIHPDLASEGFDQVVEPLRRRLVSYVLPVYNEQDGIGEFTAGSWRPRPPAPTWSSSSST